MKKKLFSLIAIFLVSVMCTSMAACDLVTTNAQRDMKQIVATVQIDDSVERDSITKRQLVNAFLNTGYQYVSQGYTYEQTFQLMMDLLVNRRVLVQQAKLDLPVINADATGVEKFLTAEEIKKCKYEVVKAVNEVIDSYEKDLVKVEETEDEEDEEEDTDTLRPVPKTYDEEEEEEIPETFAVNTNKPSEIEGSTEKTRKQAYNKFIKALHNNNLIDSVDVEDVLETTYGKDEILNQEETVLLDKYQKSIEDAATAQLSNAVLAQRWNDMVAIQKQGYANQTAYATALGSVSDESFVFVNPYGGYGYVLNLLFKPTDYVQREVTKLQAKRRSGIISIAEYEAQRAALFAASDAFEIVDERKTWITKGDEELFTLEGSTVTFGDKLLKSDALKQFDATVSKNEKGKYTVTYEDSDKLTVSAMMTLLGEKLGAGAGVDDTTYGKLYTATAANSENIFRDFMFAYSDDNSDAALNTYKGYVSAPALNNNQNGQYVKEFEKAARYVVEKGVGNYVLVVTDYGVHVIYCATQITPGEVAMPDWAAITDWDAEKANRTTAYLFREAILADLQSTAFSTVQSTQINKYTAEGAKTASGADCVIKYQKRYKDLLSLGA